MIDSVVVPLEQESLRLQLASVGFSEHEEQEVQHHHSEQTMQQDYRLSDYNPQLPPASVQMALLDEGQMDDGFWTAFTRKVRQFQEDHPRMSAEEVEQRAAAAVEEEMRASSAQEEMSKSSALADALKYLNRADTAGDSFSSPVRSASAGSPSSIHAVHMPYNTYTEPASYMYTMPESEPQAYTDPVQRRSPTGRAEQLPALDYDSPLHAQAEDRARIAAEKRHEWDDIRQNAAGAQLFDSAQKLQASFRGYSVRQRLAREEAELEELLVLIKAEEDQLAAEQAADAVVQREREAANEAAHQQRERERAEDMKIFGVEVTHKSPVYSGRGVTARASLRGELSPVAAGIGGRGASRTSSHDTSLGEESKALDSILAIGEKIAMRTRRVFDGDSSDSDDDDALAARRARNQQRLRAEAQSVSTDVLQVLGQVHQDARSSLTSTSAVSSRPPMRIVVDSTGSSEEEHLFRRTAAASPPPLPVQIPPIPASHPPPARSASALFAQLDANADGVITKEEFMTGLASSPLATLAVPAVLPSALPFVLPSARESYASSGGASHSSSAEGAADTIFHAQSPTERVANEAKRLKAAEDKAAELFPQQRGSKTVEELLSSAKTMPGAVFDYAELCKRYLPTGDRLPTDLSSPASSPKSAPTGMRSLALGTTSVSSSFKSSTMMSTLSSSSTSTSDTQAAVRLSEAIPPQPQLQPGPEPEEEEEGSYGLPRTSSGRLEFLANFDSANPKPDEVAAVESSSNSTATMLFEAMDANGDGSLSKDEMMHALAPGSPPTAVAAAASRSTTSRMASKRLAASASISRRQQPSFSPMLSSGEASSPRTAGRAPPAREVPLSSAEQMVQAALNTETYARPSASSRLSALRSSTTPRSSRLAARSVASAAAGSGGAGFSATSRAERAEAKGGVQSAASAAKVDVLFSGLDTNGDGAVSHQEFLDGMSNGRTLTLA